MKHCIQERGDYLDFGPLLATIASTIVILVSFIISLFDIRKVFIVFIVSISFN